MYDEWVHILSTQVFAFAEYSYRHDALMSLILIAVSCLPLPGRPLQPRLHRDRAPSPWGSDWDRMGLVSDCDGVYINANNT